MTLTGKGIFIWRISACEGGDVEAIANLAAQARFSHALVKVADGNFSYNVDTKTGRDQAEELVKALKARKMTVYGWHYVYGYDPRTEAERGIQRVQQLGLDGFVINAEVEYKNHHREANIYMERLRAGLPNTPIGLSSYRYPHLHPNVPWKEFLLKCDFNMPQVYWINARNPADQLERSQQAFQKLIPYRPIVPTGAMFKQGEWKPTLEEIDAFVQKARQLNMTEVNFWEWSKVRRHLPEIWDWYMAYDWQSGAVAMDISQQYITALNAGDPKEIARLYRPDAVHVTSAQAIQGVAQIEAWFSRLLKQVLPGARFKLINYAGKGSVRHLTWTATSRMGSVHNGSDTCGLLKDKIAYHYTEFSVS